MINPSMQMSGYEIGEGGGCSTNPELRLSALFNMVGILKMQLGSKQVDKIIQTACEQNGFRVEYLSSLPLDIQLKLAEGIVKSIQQQIADNY